MDQLKARLEKARADKYAAENGHREIPKIDLFKQWEDSLHREVRENGAAGKAATEKAEARLVEGLARVESGLNRAMSEAVRAFAADVVSKLPREADLTGVSGQIEDLSAAITKAIKSIPPVDLSVISKALEDLVSRETMEMPDQVDYSAQLGAIEARLAELEKPKTVVFDVERINSNPLSPIKRVVAKVKK